MTGIGKASGDIGEVHYLIEIKSVNHRYIDVRFRAPSFLSAFELAALELVRKHFERGSFELQIRMKAPKHRLFSQGTRFAVDTKAAESLMESVQWLEKKFTLEKGVSAELFFTKGVVVQVDEDRQAESQERALKKLVETALLDLKKMRAEEGKRLAKELSQLLSDLKVAVEAARHASKGQEALIRDRLTQRIKDWAIKDVDAGRLETEVVFFADKADITEEIARLKSHLDSFETLIEESLTKRSGAVGRRLEFLTQELHREASTVGSKASGIELSHCSLRLKSAIEKLREQIQNVE